MQESFKEALQSLGALADDLRQGMYLYIRQQGRPVGRGEAAEAVGISNKLAAFHLDKLVEKGLLKTHYARLSGRTGPGAGRTSKLYEPSDKEVSVSIPPRAYDLMGSILVDTLGKTRPGESSREAALRVAADSGRRFGEAEASPAAKGRVDALALAEQALAENGYEPYRDTSGRVALRNCPYHSLAQRSPELVCGINHAFVGGLLAGLDAGGVEAILEPTPGECCVKLQAEVSSR